MKGRARAAAPAADDICAIVSLMYRHEQEPQDAYTAPLLRRRTLAGTLIRPGAKAVFFGASYHADYATLQCQPSDVQATADAFVESLAGKSDAASGDQPWDVIDLRRLRADDPALPALELALRVRAHRHGWEVIREHEDVCPVVTVPEGADWDGYLATLNCGDRLIFAALAFDDGETCYLYNAGLDPDAAQFSPGVSGTNAYIRDRLAAGRRRFDFMRGNEPYKYEWGARDEPIARLIALRGEAR